MSVHCMSHTHGLAMIFLRDSLCLSAVFLSRQRHDILDFFLLSLVTRFACDINQLAKNLDSIFIQDHHHPIVSIWPGGGGTPYNGLYGEAPPKRGTFFRLQVYKRIGISQVEVYKRVRKSVVSQRELNE